MAGWDYLFINVNMATMSEKGVGIFDEHPPYGLVPDAAIGVKYDRIVFADPMVRLLSNPTELAEKVIDVGGRMMTPGLIDCHTHLVFGGNRAAEFEQRLNGATYEEIAKSGGGILSTVAATRASDLDDLVEEAELRLHPLLEEGVTTIEIKSGYGLNLASERKMLEAARALGQRNPVRVVTSFLGAHALPREYAGKRDVYIKNIVDTMLPKLAEEGLVDAVDGFCERIGFRPAEIRKIFRKAKALGLPVKLHADQLSDLGGGAIVAEFSGLSADHLEWLNEDGIAAMEKAGTAAVLLPGAFYALKETRLPPIDALRKANIPIAIASDANPGSSPVLSLLLMLNMACTLFGLTPEEALAGVTRNGAKALGLGDEIGTLEVGKAADLAVWDVDSPGELAYWIGGNPLCFSVHAGKIQMVADANFLDA
jgi:imidazolonepropionase